MTSIFKDTEIDSTDALTLPSGTTAQRPNPAQDGMIRYNTDLETIEIYDSEYSVWYAAYKKLPMVASGGTATTPTINGTTYKLHQYTSGSSTFVVTRPGDVEYLIVAGGGGGGDSFTNGSGTGPGAASGGGGGGGVLRGKMFLDVGTYTVVVGAGGAGANETVTGYTPGARGENSIFHTLIAYGGGGGDSGNKGTNPDPQSRGGSGGGAGYLGIGGKAVPGQGNNGGDHEVQGGPYSAGGGGGAGGPGGSQHLQITNRGGNGGPGIASDITGSLTYYAGGGGGGGEGYLFAGGPGIPGRGGIGGGGDGAARDQAAGNASANTGGGGGGSIGQASYPGGNGGSGIVIIRYPIS